MATSPSSAWLRQTYEEALEHELPICDTHHHFWDHGEGDRYLVPELLEDMAGGHNVVATVFVECNSGYRKDGPEALKPVGETEFVASMVRDADPRAAAGIVGYADLLLGGAVVPVLEAHLAASPDRFRGIRYWTTWDEHPKEVQLRTVAPKGLVYDGKFREGFACLERYGLSYDAWMLFPQLPEAADLARAFPGITIILGHIGGLVGVGPYSNRDEVLERWKRNVAEVAKCPNVVMKIGGIGLQRLGFGWHERDKPTSSGELAQAFAPYCMHCIEQFGPERCMFESNFPVDKASASYNAVWNAFKRLTEKLNSAERSALFHDTAARVYRLDR
ncbi:MAG: amidohydrolase [Betaproteobacteria bacterium RIFCSPLOWO2_02_FULL_62_17]|nr:MAG: amidohydrolase [Betaproteobacteria bacterium RIFCSPLOWO2_02_FULL_62_17]